MTGLTNTVSYRFRVRALNVAGSGAPTALSNTVTATTGLATAPGAPTIRTATAGVAGAPITATANWRVPTSIGSSPITGYRVTAIRTGVANIVSAVLAPQAVTDQRFSMTLPAGDYRFTVVAINAAGTSLASGQSNLVTAR